MLSAEADAALFFEFAKGSMQQVGVFSVTPAAGERPVTRPGIFLPLGAADEQNGFPRQARTDDRYRCLGFCHVDILARSIPPLRFASEQSNGLDCLRNDHYSGVPLRSSGGSQTNHAGERL